MKRFWDKVKKTDTCWLWMACRTKLGYGVLSGPKHGDSNLYAHRVYWELENGCIPDGLCVLHRCDNPACVRPEHLFLGTKKDNTQDMLQKGRNRHGNFPIGLNHPRPMARLDWEKAKTIRHLYFAERKTAKELGNYFGVATHTVEDVIANRSWLP